MKKYALQLICIAVLMLSNTNIYSQESSDTTSKQLVQIVMMNGDMRVGYIISDDGREILIETEAIGNIYIQKSDIKSISPIDEEETDIFMGDIRIAGPFTTRYQFTTNALPIKKGENYTMIHLYGPEVHAAITDRLSLGVLTSWGASPFVGAVKYTIPTTNEKVNFGLGGLVGTSGYLNLFRGYGGLGWGMVTFGDRLKNLTISAGFAYLQTGFWDYTSRVEPGTYYPDTTNGYNNWNFNYNYEMNRVRAPITSPVVSVAGITKVGEKSSLFFDGMVFFGNQTQDIQTTDFYYNDGTLVQGYGYDVADYAIVTNTITDVRSTVIVFMPGMRFQSKPNRAFQFTIAGITRIQNGNINAFPIPNCSWFIKF